MRRLMVDSLRQRRLGDSLTLSAAAAHHLQVVLRGKAGLKLALHDAHSWHAPAQLLLSDSGAQVQLLADAVQLPPPARMTLAVVAPRPERAAWLVEKAAELAVGCVHWLVTAHAQPYSRQLRLPRLQRVAQAAAQQAGVAQLLQQLGPTPLGDYLALPRPPGLCHVVATYDGMSLAQLLAHRQPTAASMAGFAAIIGPEGGLSDEEQAQVVAAGALPLALGPGILRVETAAICAAALGQAALAWPASPPADGA